MEKPEPTASADMEIYAEIPLTRGLFAKVDPSDFARMSTHKWHARANPSGRTFYASRWNPSKNGSRIISMHNEIMGGFGIDHINADGLDNRRSNLRLATRSQNNANRRTFKNNTTGAKGVDFRHNKYRVRIQLNGRSFYLGAYKTLSEASKIYSEAAKKFHGQFAKQ